MRYKEVYLREMQRRGIKYIDVNDTHVKVRYNGDNTNEIEVNVIFNDDDTGFVALRCWSFGKIPENKRSLIINKCNELNAKYRWEKFYVDNDSDLAVGMDAITDINTVGNFCIQLVSRMVNIYDEAFPELMRVLWS